MAEEGTLCINADVLKKAGANANSTVTAEAYTNVYIKMVEGTICAVSKYDWVTNYASISTIGKEFLRNLASSYAAFLIISYDMGGFTSRIEAQVMLDTNYSVIVEGMKLLSDDNYRTFILGGAL